MSVASDSMDTAVDSHGSDGSTTAGPPILVVLVLYQRCETFNSPSLTSFLNALDKSGLKSSFRIFIYDNSPFKSKLPDSFPIPFQYFHDPGNGGLFRAYTAALQLAEKNGHEWLLLLDQDTVLDVHYLETLRSALVKTASNSRCAALVPKLLSKQRIISPTRVYWGGWTFPVKTTFAGYPRWEIMALNSGTLLRISAIRALGGLEPKFWLDYLDHWLFNRLQAAGHLINVLDTALPHSLSVKKMSSVSIARYRNILSAEGEFYRCCKSRGENLVYYFKLIIRLCKMCVIPGRYKFFLPTLEHFSTHVRQQKPSIDRSRIL